MRPPSRRAVASLHGIDAMDGVPVLRLGPHRPLLAVERDRGRNAALAGGWPHTHCSEYIHADRIGLVINIPRSNEEEELSDDHLIRRTAIDHQVPLLTNLHLTERLVEAQEIADVDNVPIPEWSEL